MAHFFDTPLRLAPAALTAAVAKVAGAAPDAADVEKRGPTRYCDLDERSRALAKMTVTDRVTVFGTADLDSIIAKFY